MDVRFLSVEFLNTYLTTYRIFSDAVVLFDSLLQWYYSKAQFEYPNATVDQFDRTVKTMEFKPKGNEGRVHVIMCIQIHENQTKNIDWRGYVVLAEFLASLFPDRWRQPRRVPFPDVKILTYPYLPISVDGRVVKALCFGVM